MGPPPFEDIYLHSYQAVRDESLRPRLSLVIPSIDPAKAFGGVVTALDFFLEAGKRSGAELRLILDDFASSPDTSILEKRARALGLASDQISVMPRGEQDPTLDVRVNDIFVTYNWWITLNIRKLISQQAVIFGIKPGPTSTSFRTMNLNSMSSPRHI